MRIVALLLSILVCRGAATPDSADYLKYSPQRNTDILHLALDIEPDFTGETFSGAATIRFKPLFAKVREWKLDAVDLTIKEVKGSVPIAAFQNTDKALIITFAEDLPAEGEQTVTITYHATPKKGLYFRGPKQGYDASETHLFTQGEDEDSRYWFPTHDFPDDKFTSELSCRVPEGMIALSNGKKVAERADGATRIFHFLQDKPHVSYLVCLVAGYFKAVEDRYKEIPLAFYTTPRDFQYAAGSFRDTKEAMGFFEEEIGVPYPWARYDQVCVADFMYGGMENTTLSVLTDGTLFPEETENIRDSLGLMAHELAHQWFGDLVTLEDWSHAWINEGFASYYGALFAGHKYGQDELLYLFHTSARDEITGRSAGNDTRGLVSRRFDNAMEIFQNGAYPKGAWVLRMLRHQLGDELFRKCIKTFLERHAYQSVDTHDLLAILEEQTGRSWDQFFDQWIYRPHFPRLDAAYSWDETAKLAKLSIKQSQPVTNNIHTFTTPLTVRFKVAGKNADRDVTIRERNEDFQFALDSAPTGVRIDPDSTLLARINFQPPRAMLHAQLEDDADVIGRLLAIEAIEKDRSDDSVARLRKALARDKFYGVRIAAANALGNIRSPAALEALLAAADQPDARVRQRVVIALGNFYDERAFARFREFLKREKNPDIIEWALQGLAAAPKASEEIASYLEAKTFKQEVAARAFNVLAARRDTAQFQTVFDTARRRWDEFPTRTRSASLQAIATLARDNATNRIAAREFLQSHLNNPRQGIRTAAIRALGELRDEEAIPALETFAKGQTTERPRAEAAIATIRSARSAANESEALRNEVAELKKETQALRDELKALTKKVEAPPAAKPPARKR